MKYFVEFSVFIKRPVVLTHVHTEATLRRLDMFQCVRRRKVYKGVNVYEEGRNIKKSMFMKKEGV